MGACSSSEEDGREKTAYDFSLANTKEECQTSSYKKKSDEHKVNSYSQYNDVNHRNNISVEGEEKKMPITTSENKDPEDIENDTNEQKSMKQTCDHSSVNEFALKLAKRILSEIRYISEAKDDLKSGLERNQISELTAETDIEIRVPLTDVNSEKTGKSNNLDDEQNIPKYPSITEWTSYSKFAVDVTEKILYEVRNIISGKRMGKTNFSCDGNLQVDDVHVSLNDEDFHVGSNDGHQRISKVNLNQYSEKLALNILNDTRVEVLPHAL